MHTVVLTSKDRSLRLILFSDFMLNFNFIYKVCHYTLILRTNRVRFILYIFYTTWHSSSESAYASDIVLSKMLCRHCCTISRRYKTLHIITHCCEVKVTNRFRTISTFFLQFPFFLIMHLNIYKLKYIT